MEILTSIGSYLALVFFFPLLYFFGYCFVYFYISIPSILFINYSYYSLFNKKFKFSLKKQILFNLCLLLIFPLMEIVHLGVIRTIQIVIPDGYMGNFEIIEDKDKGEPIPRTGLTYRVVVPPSGILRVNSLAPWRSTYSEKPIYASGKPIPDGRSDKTSSNVPALYGGGMGHSYGYPGKKVDVTYVQYYLGPDMNVHNDPLNDKKSEVP